MSPLSANGFLLGVTSTATIRSITPHPRPWQSSCQTCILRPSKRPAMPLPGYLAKKAKNGLDVTSGSGTLPGLR